MCNDFECKHEQYDNFSEKVNEGTGRQQGIQLTLFDRA